MSDPISPTSGIADVAAKGGRARANALTPAQRSDIARHAVEARWEKAGKTSIPRVTHGSPDHPLKLGDAEIPCYVLEDRRRVLAHRGMLKALGLSKGGGEAGEEGNRLARFAAGKSLSGFISEDLLRVMGEPIKFRLPNGVAANGYEATILADICDAVLAARNAGALMHHQMHVAIQCEVLLRGFAKVGIIALVDECTGYQYDRPRRDLEKYLEKFLSETLRRWVRTFPADYFKHLCRLRGVELRPDMKLPQYFGLLTNNLIYRRIAPGLLKRLKERREERGKPNDKLHSWLSVNLGVPEILVHLGTVIGLMKTNTDYETFEKQLDQIAPKYTADPGLFDNADDWDASKFKVGEPSEV